MSATPAPALRVTGMSKAFGGVHAIRDVDVELAAGAVTGLVGANGSGKSTFVDCVTGFQRPDAGMVLLGERDVTRASRRDRALLGLRRTFQAVHAFTGLTAREHLEIAQQETDGVGWLNDVLRTPRRRRADAEAVLRAEEALELVGLTHMRHRPADAMSYGQQKLLGLACGLVTEPSVLCLDEPLAGVSPNQTDLLVGVLERLHDRHQTLLIIEHNMDFITHISDTIVVFAQGAVAAVGPPSILRDDDAVFDALMGAA